MTHGRKPGSRIVWLSLIVVLASLVSCQPAGSEVIQPDPTVEPGRLFLFVEENPPGPEPEPFGADWFQGGFHSAPVFAPDGKTVWWAGKYNSQKIYSSRYLAGSWTDQEEVSFSDEIWSYRDPFISPDGLRFYFISTAALPGENIGGKENLWMMVWEDGGWGEPQPLPEVVNQFQLHWTPSVASNYDLYFSANFDGNPEILKSVFKDGTYTEPIPLGYPVNGEELEFTPNIAPDQSYLLFSRARDQNSPTQLYISYALDKGWTEAIRVENVEDCISPIITPDRKYVIYLAGPSALMWRDTSFIEELRPE